MPQLLFDEVGYAVNPFGGLFRNWDMHPDGSRFVMVVTTGREQGLEATGLALTEVYVVTNWFEELKQRMGELMSDPVSSNAAPASG